MIYLDFDGVLIDSAAEAFEVGRRTFVKVYNVNMSTDFWSEFIFLRPLVTAAWNYNLVFKVIEKKMSQEEAIGFLKKEFKYGATLEDKVFELCFIETRRRWAREDKNGWIASAPPFRFFSEIVESMLRAPHCFTIISTKDSDSIREIIQYHFPAVGDLRIFGKSSFEQHGNVKAAIIRNDSEYLGKGIFIDDGEEHLISARQIKGLDVHLAGWGYVDIEYKNDNTDDVIEKINQFLERECHYHLKKK